MTFTEIFMALAAFAGPLVAVQVTRFLDDRKESRSRKVQLYHTLMATRATNLSPAHIEALNRIDLEFSADKRRERPVVAAWQLYLDHLGDKGMDLTLWVDKRLGLLVDLLHAMGKALDYDFDKVRIKNAVYFPNSQQKLEQDQQQLRASVLEVFEGKRAIPVRIAGVPVTVPPPPAAAAQQLPGS